VVVVVVEFVLFPVVIRSMSFKPCLSFLTRFAMLLRGFEWIGSCRLDGGEIGELDAEAGK
jgi:hypothetical protein